MLVVSAEGSAAQLHAFYKQSGVDKEGKATKVKGAHMVLNSALLDLEKPGCMARCVSDKVNEWLEDKPTKMWSAWRVSIAASLFDVLQQ